MRGWKFYIATFGCKVNQYESQLLREGWQKAGGTETLDPAEADFVLINSCAITARAERNCRNAVFRLRQLAGEAKIILTGCAAQFYAGFQPRKGANWATPDLCITQSAKKALLAGPFAGAQQPGSAITAYVRARPVIKVQDGCAHNCSYCIVPQTRPKPESRPPQEILAECLRLAEGGCGELVLSGINLRHYNAGCDFWSLLAWLDRQLTPAFAGRLRLRISSLDPAMLNKRALEVLAGCNLVCPHLHLSLQHASPAILKAMRRSHYKPAEIISFCKDVAGFWPVFGLGADIITGFPGETEADVGLLLDFIGDLPFTYAHVFPYSRRPGTPAALMPRQIAKREKEARAWRIREAITAKQHDFWQRQLARGAMAIAADGPEDGRKGRGINEFYAPCVFDWPENIDEPRRLLKAVPTGVCAAGIKATIAPWA